MRSMFRFPLLAGFAALALNAAAGPQVPVVTLGAKAVSTGYELDGVVEAVRQATVSAQATGRVASLLVKVGDKVRAGQVLVTIDDRDTQTGVAAARRKWPKPRPNWPMPRPMCSARVICANRAL